MQKWEYKYIYASQTGVTDENLDWHEGLSGYLNELGNEGWDMINVLPWDKPTGQMVIFFKRPVELLTQ